MRLSRFPLSLAALVALALAAPAQDKKPLVTRDRVQLNLAGAEAVVAAAKEKAAAMGLKVNVAVVDDGGHLLAFARMDGARPASAATAMAKAASAATFRQETGPLPARGEPDVLLSLALQAASGGKVTPLKGGVPITIDGQVVGAVGVGGGTGEQDAEVAKAGIRALTDALGGKK
jgi:glc operon protein GlcG